jgi:hypothetical protein
MVNAHSPPPSPALTEARVERHAVIKYETLCADVIIIEQPFQRRLTPANMARAASKLACVPDAKLNYLLDALVEEVAQTQLDKPCFCSLSFGDVVPPSPTAAAAFSINPLALSSVCLAVPHLCVRFENTNCSSPLERATCTTHFPRVWWKHFHLVAGLNTIIFSRLAF